MERPGLAIAATVRSSARLVAARQSVLTTLCRGSVADLMAVGHPLLRPGEPDLVALFVDNLLRAMLDDHKDAGGVESSWHRLGGLLSGLRVTEADWQTLGHVVLRAARLVCGDSWSSSVSSGWAAYHVWMAHHLARGAAAAASPEASGGPGPATPTLPRHGGRLRPDPERGLEPFEPWTRGWM